MRISYLNNNKNSFIDKLKTIIFKFRFAECLNIPEITAEKHISEDYLRNVSEETRNISEDSITITEDARNISEVEVRLLEKLEAEKEMLDLWMMGEDEEDLEEETDFLQRYR